MILHEHDIDHISYIKYLFRHDVTLSDEVLCHCSHLFSEVPGTVEKIERRVLGSNPVMEAFGEKYKEQLMFQSHFLSEDL